MTPRNRDAAVRTSAQVIAGPDGARQQAEFALLSNTAPGIRLILSRRPSAAPYSPPHFNNIPAFAATVESGGKVDFPSVLKAPPRQAPAAVCTCNRHGAGNMEGPEPAAVSGYI